MGSCCTRILYSRIDLPRLDEDCCWQCAGGGGGGDGDGEGDG